MSKDVDQFQLQTETHLSGTQNSKNVKGILISSVLLEILIQILHFYAYILRYY